MLPQITRSSSDGCRLARGGCGTVGTVRRLYVTCCTLSPNCSEVFWLFLVSPATFRQAWMSPNSLRSDPPWHQLHEVVLTSLALRKNMCRLGCKPTRSRLCHASMSPNSLRRELPWHELHEVATKVGTVPNTSRTVRQLYATWYKLSSNCSELVSPASPNSLRCEPPWHELHEVALPSSLLKMCAVLVANLLNCILGVGYAKLQWVSPNSLRCTPPWHKLHIVALTSFALRTKREIQATFVKSLGEVFFLDYCHNITLFGRTIANHTTILRAKHLLLLYSNLSH